MVLRNRGATLTAPRLMPIELPLALFRLFATDDALAAAMEAMGRFNLKHQPGQQSSIEPRDREIVIDCVCACCRCEYE